jgi:hypothetical protein
MEHNLYYNVGYLHLSGRGYVVLRNYKNGRKLIQFPTFANQTVVAFPNDLNGTHKIECEKEWEAERLRIAQIHGWN